MLVVQKVRLYPTAEQVQGLTKNFGAVRRVWNYFLGKSIEEYQESKKGFKFSQACKELTALKKTEDYLWLSEADSQALQQSLKNLEKAFKNFFEGRARFPKFKSKFHKQSIAYPQRVSVVEQGVKLPKIGLIKAKITRPLEGKVKTVTISKTTTDKYFASILFEVKDIEVIPQAEIRITGIDLGLIDVITGFDGEKTHKVKNPRHFKKIRKNLRRKQQNLSRCQKGSNRRNKAKKLVAKVYEHLANSRQDFYHKISRKLTDDNQVLVFENLNIKGLKRTKLSKSLNDACLGMLINFCQYKIERKGGKLIEIGRFFPSSQICSHCGFKSGKKPLNIREWTCPNCSTHHDRDENASKNIREEGIRIMSQCGLVGFQQRATGVAVGLTASARGETSKTRSTNKLKRHLSLNRESPVKPLVG